MPWWPLAMRAALAGPAQGTASGSEAVETIAPCQRIGCPPFRHRGSAMPGDMMRRTACFLSVVLLAVQTCAGPANPESSATTESPVEQTADDPNASLKLGLMFERGTLVSQDFAAAARWYRRAADLGNVAAMFHLAAMYDQGRGVPMDHGEAARWYGKAAAARYGPAEYRLGLMYESGDGVPADRTRAAALFKAAAKHGIDAARQKVAAAASPEGSAGNSVPHSAANSSATAGPPDAGRPAPSSEPPAGQPLASGPQGGDASVPGAATGGPAVSRPQGDEASLPAPRAGQGPVPEARGGGAPASWPDPQLAEIQPVLLQRTMLASDDPRLSTLAQAADSIAAAAEGRDGLAAYDLGYCFEHGIGKQKDLVRAYVWYMRAQITAADAAVKQAASDAALPVLLLLSDAQYQEATALLMTGR